MMNRVHTRRPAHRPTLRSGGLQAAFPVALLALLLAAVLLLATGCDGGSSPTEAGSPSLQTAVSTRLGSLEVVSHSCGGELDPQRMRNEIETTARIADMENPDLGVFVRQVLEGYELHARSPEDSARRCDGGLACFEPAGSRGRLHVWCDGGGVEHETAHAIAYAAGLPCWQEVYHGYDFRCRRNG